MNKTTYMSSLISLAGTRKFPDTSMWPLAHTSGAQGFGSIMKEPQPELRSNALRGKSKIHNGHSGNKMVFAYAAPCVKTLRGGVVLVFAAAYMDSADSNPICETAHPFDSGGLRRYTTLATRFNIPGLVKELTFDSNWRKDLSIYVAALFDGPDHYLRGLNPSRIDPLKMASASGTHDRQNFTWEIMTEDRIAFAGRLVAAVVILNMQGQPTIGVAEKELERRASRGEIVFERVPRNQVHTRLAELYSNTADVTGWQ